MSVPAKQLKRRTPSQKLKMPWTLDTYSLNFVDYVSSKLNQTRINHSFYSLDKAIQRTQKDHKSNFSKSKSLQSILRESKIRESTSKSKSKRLPVFASETIRTRMKTQYNQVQQPCGFRKFMKELKKRLVFQNQDEFRFDAFKVLKLLHETSKQRYFSVKAGTNQPLRYTLIVTKHPQVRHHYQIQSACQYEITSSLYYPQQKKLFLKVHKIWKQKKQWIVTIDNFLNLSWSNDQFYLFLNRFKTDHYLLKSLLKQISAAILALSNIGRAHNNINLQSIYFLVAKGQLRCQQIKVGGLSLVMLAQKKEGFLRMPLLYRTPPEILNFILFEEQQPFDRDYLQQITHIKQGWQTDVWSLGILCLQLLNGGPLPSEGIDCYKLITLQKQLLIRYSYLLQKVDCDLQMCLCNMLSLNPRNRPHPKYIMQML